MIIGMFRVIRKWIASEYGMRITERFYPTKKNDPEHRALFFKAMNRYKKCTDKKNKSQIRREIQLCKKYWKCYPHHYFMYDLYRKEVKLTDDELKNYIPQFFWYRLFLPHYRLSKYMLITDNKIITDLFLRNLKIPQPETLFYILNGAVYSPEMMQLTSDQIQVSLDTTAVEKIFVKPAHGSGGYGITIFHKTDTGHYMSRQNLFLNGDFLDRIKNNQDYIIQAGVIQDPEISKMYSGSVNTFRVMTENRDGVVRVVCAVMRIGRGQSEIDNISSGGILVKTDIHTGKLGDFALSYNCEKFEEQPDTHFVFQNFIISRWDEIMRFTMNAAGKIPLFTHLGWDIALTANGPVVIEINSNPAQVELSNGGLREEFAIKNPDYYWKNPGKRGQ
jgi:hypothetical protein